MVKYLAMIAAVLASMAIAEQAQAFGRHGCRSCGGGYAGGCPGGNCSVSYGAPTKSAAVTNAPPGLVESSAPASAPVVTTYQPTTNYAYTPVRRGLFGRR